MAITVTPVAGGTGGVQADYPLKIGEGRLGLIYDNRAFDVISRMNTDTQAIVFGQPLSFDGAGKVKRYTKANGFAGIAVISDTFVPEARTVSVGGTSRSLPGYPIKKMVNTMITGSIWVYVSTNVTADSVVALLDAGSDLFCASGTANSTDIKARFLNSASAGQLVPIHLEGLI